RGARKGNHCTRGAWRTSVVASWVREQRARCKHGVELPWVAHDLRRERTAELLRIECDSPWHLFSWLRRRLPAIYGQELPGDAEPLLARHLRDHRRSVSQIRRSLPGRSAREPRREKSERSDGSGMGPHVERRIVP